MESLLTLMIATVFMMTLFIQVMISIKKEKTREYRRMNEQFILPHLNDVLLFIEAETDYLKGNGIDVKIDPHKVIKSIQNKSSYSNAQIINALYRYQNASSYFQGKGEAKTLTIYEVFFFYLDCAYENFQKSKYADEVLFHTIGTNQKIYGMAFILTSLFGKEEALKILSHKKLWNPDFLNKLPIDLLEDLIVNYNSSKMEEHKLLVFLTILKADFFELQENERMTELKNYIEEAIVSVKGRWAYNSG
jgi:hypothetical protein